MNSKGKGIITAVIVVLIALAAFCGFGYISQRMTASEGITYLDKKEYQKAYEQFDHAAGKFTLIFTKQKKDVLFYEGEALYQMGEYGKAIEIYDQLYVSWRKPGIFFESILPCPAEEAKQSNRCM